MSVNERIDVYLHPVGRRVVNSRDGLQSLERERAKHDGALVVIGGMP